MSTKRILGITAFGILFIAAVIGIMLIASYVRRDNDAIPLPEAQTPVAPSGETEPDALDRVEVGRDNIREVVASLSRPDTYSRDIIIETFWEDSRTEYNIAADTTGGITSLRIAPLNGPEKRIIVSPDMIYIWYMGDRTPYTGSPEDAGDGYRTADEWQMLFTYEDVLELNEDDIIDAGYTEFRGEYCIYAEYRSPLLGYTREYYVSIDLGLIIGAEEYDENGALVYRMTASEYVEGEVDAQAFTLPDGTAIVH